MTGSQLTLRVGGSSSADSATRATELSEELGRYIEGIEVEQRRDDEQTMDFGATLVLVLGAPAIVELARAIHAYMRRTGVTVVIKTGEQEIALSGLERKMWRLLLTPQSRAVLVSMKEIGPQRAVASYRCGAFPKYQHLSAPAAFANSAATIRNTWSTGRDLAALPTPAHCSTASSGRSARDHR